MVRHIVIIGAMGVGKTTVGKLLAARMGLPFIDSDVGLETAHGDTGSTIAAREGIERLHELELRQFLDMCRREEKSVIAPAASVVDHPDGRHALAENLTVWLTAPDRVVARRQGTGDHRRRIGDVERIALSRRRAPLLEEVSTITVDTADSTPEEIVADLEERL